MQSNEPRFHYRLCRPLNPKLAEVLFCEKRKSKSIFFLYKKKSRPILLLYPISILSSKVKHNGSRHKYTQLVMLTHYSPLRGWLHLSRLVTSITKQSSFLIFYMRREGAGQARDRPHEQGRCCFSFSDQGATICTPKGTQKQENQVKINGGGRSRLLRQVHNSQIPESENKRSSCSKTWYFADTHCDLPVTHFL
jgi:hypothetical protein